MKLNSKQRMAVDFMHQFMQGAAPMMVLEGYAGTGKTTCVQTFCKETNSQVVFTAPTNKATKVLRKMAAEAGNNVDCATIYSLLGLVLSNDGEIRTVAARGENRAEMYHVVVIDEGSMVGQNLFKHIEDAARNFHIKIIFMGDPAQLPPVGEYHSPVFDLSNKITLTEVMRHDNQILTLATHIRECIYNGESPSLVADNDENGGVFIANSNRFNNRLAEGFTSDSYHDHPDSFKTIAWRNVTVQGHNNLIRSAMYEREGHEVTEAFELGERIVACAPVMDIAASLRGETEVCLHTDEEATVESIEPSEHPIYKEIMCHRVELLGDYEDSFTRTAYVVAAESERAQKALLSRLADKAKKRQGSWSSFWDAKEAFHDLRPCHAITAHRSQGSTYGTVFVNVGDIMLNRNKKEALQCLYVAVSRASRIVVLKTR